MAHVFLSYLREDEEVVEKIAAELRRQGLEGRFAKLASIGEQRDGKSEPHVPRLRVQHVQ